MASLQIGITPHRRAAARFVGSVRRKLQKAFADAPEVTQAQIAASLDVHRSVINRQLRGTADIGLARVAEIACLLGYSVALDLEKIEAAEGQNIPLPGHPNTFKYFSAQPATSVSRLPENVRQFEAAE